MVFVINGLTKGNWAQAFFFALAVAVGLTPEMLPMIVTVCLSKGAVAMGSKKVIVKRLNAIQNLGAMDVLCTDKTGTLTMDQVTLERHCDVMLQEERRRARRWPILNSHFQTGLKNVLDRAVLAHDRDARARADPGDRQGGRDSVRLPAPHHVGRGPHARGEGSHHLQRRARGDLLAVRQLRARRPGAADGPRRIAELKDEYERLSADGFRVLAIATKDVAAARGEPPATHALRQSRRVRPDPERLCGVPRSAQGDRAAAIKDLQGHGVAVKVLTGDNDLVARKICKEVGLSTAFVLLGR